MALAAAPLALSAEATKELKMAYDADPVTLDIHEQLSGGMLQLSHMTFDPLIRWNKDLGFDARLAESWERVDDKTMQFQTARRR
jgi:peptide/nickel transport system substrate-binding protein